MSLISVDTEALKDIEKRFSTLSKKLGQTESSLRSIRSNLDSDIKNRNGMIAKPTIDILLEVFENVENDYIIRQMEENGYIYSPQVNNPPPHMMYLKGYTPEGFKGQAYHVHVRYAGDWDELYFRDYLISNPDLAKRYGLLKLELKKIYEFDRDGYTEAKSEFIKEVTQMAKNELKGKI
jgi:GrpB-like predicted nucleotidyltransferase (UPF0157 family)